MTAGTGVRAALDAHRPVWITVTGSDAFTAACYAPGCDFGDGTEDEHRAHLADVLAPLLDEAAADAWDEGWRARCYTQAELEANPHRARREDAPNPWGDDHLTPVRLRPATEDEL